LDRERETGKDHSPRDQKERRNLFFAKFGWLEKENTDTMGRLIKNHWARLITLTAAAYQVAAAIEGFFWPKIFFDFLTKTLDPIVAPVPALQVINLLMGFMMFAWEYPLSFVAGSAIHRSLEARLAVLPLTALASILLYQATNSAIYYLVAMIVYFWAYSEGEIVCAKPWTLPQRSRSGGRA
jgi:hypothetical protein